MAFISKNKPSVPFTGDSGTGGKPGAVPAPAAADAASNKVLHADGSWQAVGGLLGFKGLKVWSSGSVPDKSPTLAEFNTALGTTAGDIGTWCFMVEDGVAVGSNSTFIAFKKANAGVLADYHAVEMS